MCVGVGVSAHMHAHLHMIASCFSQQKVHDILAPLASFGAVLQSFLRVISHAVVLSKLQE